MINIIGILITSFLINACFLSNNRFYYEVLGVPFWASDEDIKKSFNDLSKKYHPDSGGQYDKYTKIQRAYEILSNRSKKLIYDTDGIEEVERYEHATANGYANQRYRKTPDQDINLSVTLEELYKGNERNIAIRR